MPIIADLSALPPQLRQGVAKVCTDEFNVQAQLAKLRQQKIAKFHADHTGRAIEGVGGQEMAIDPFFVSYFNQHHRTSFWEDLHFREWLKKRYDWLRVKTGGTKIQVSVGGLSAGATPKFSKKFN